MTLLATDPSDEKKAHRGLMPTLEMQGGSKPSVKVTKVWLEKVRAVLKDYEGLEKLVAGMLKDPRGYKGLKDPRG